jgi:hypothetical protein
MLNSSASGQLQSQHEQQNKSNQATARTKRTKDKENFIQ